MFIRGVCTVFVTQVGSVQDLRLSVIEYIKVNFTSVVRNSGQKQEKTVLRSACILYEPGFIVRFTL